MSKVDNEARRMRKWMAQLENNCIEALSNCDYNDKETQLGTSTVLQIAREFQKKFPLETEMETTQDRPIDIFHFTFDLGRDI